LIIGQENREKYRKDPNKHRKIFSIGSKIPEKTGQIARRTG